MVRVGGNADVAKFVVQQLQQKGVKAAVYSDVLRIQRRNRQLWQLFRTAVTVLTTIFFALTAVASIDRMHSTFFFLVLPPLFCAKRPAVLTPDGCVCVSGSQAYGYVAAMTMVSRWVSPKFVFCGIVVWMMMIIALMPPSTLFAMMPVLDDERPRGLNVWWVLMVLNSTNR